MKSVSSLLLAAVFLFTAAGHAEPSSALEFIKARHDRICSLLSEGDHSKLESVLDNTIDYQTLIEASFGPHWSELTSDQRTEFYGLMKSLVRRSYERNIGAAARHTIGWRSIGDLVVRGVAVDDAKIDTNDVDYVLTHRGDSFAIVDVIVEGSSLVANYRRQFDRAIKKDGVETLLRKMREKSKKGNP